MAAFSDAWARLLRISSGPFIEALLDTSSEVSEHPTVEAAIHPLAVVVVELLRAPRTGVKVLRRSWRDRAVPS